MRIALLQPCYWPEVSRGTERVVHDIGRQLAERGHDVTLLTSHPGATTVTEEDGMRVIRDRRPPQLSPMRWYEDHLSSAPKMIWRLLRGRYDVANAFHPAYAWAAVRARAAGGPPVVFSFHGIPERGYLVQRRYRLEQITAAVQGAAECTVLSAAAAADFRKHLLREPVVLPAGYFAEDFSRSEERDPRPSLVCAASLDDPRKRGALLLAGFRALHVRRPDVRLELLGRPGSLPPATLELPVGAIWSEAGGIGEVAAAYRRARASVLCATGEALGLVMVESLASGTPVVAARSGAGPEIVNDATIGTLFEPDSEEDLAKAMEETIELSERPGTAAACRARAEAFEWRHLMDRHEELYEAAARSGERSASHG